MLYEAIPVLVDAHVIWDTRHIGDKVEVLIHLPGGPGEPESDDWVELPDGATSRYMPVAGDYWVRQEDGYIYINPKAVFERKYRPRPITLAGDITTMDEAKVAGLTPKDATVPVVGQQIGSAVGDVGPKAPSPAPTEPSPATLGPSSGPTASPEK